jgi:hypothetical protein
MWARNSVDQQIFFPLENLHYLIVSWEIFKPSSIVCLCRVLDPFEAYVDCWLWRVDHVSLNSSRAFCVELLWRIPYQGFVLVFVIGYVSQWPRVGLKILFSEVLSLLLNFLCIKYLWHRFWWKSLLLRRITAWTRPTLEQPLSWLLVKFW